MIEFREKDHVYKKQGVDKPTSVTTFIHEFEQPYPRQFWLMWGAIKAIIKEKDRGQYAALVKKMATDSFSYSLDKEQILKRFVTNSQYTSLLKEHIRTLDAQWKRANKESTDYGTKVHEEKENWINEQNGRQGINTKHKYVGEWKQSFPLTDLEPGIWYSELILDYRDLCGTADVFMYEIDQSNTTNRGKYILHINDWKTNKDLKFKSWNENTYMKAPVSHLDQCEWSIYRLQLSLYLFMIMQQFGGEQNCIIGSAMITHIDRVGKHSKLPFVPLMKEVKDMLKWSNRL